MGGCTEVGWRGVDMRSKPAELRVFFKHSNFAGYSYYRSVPFEATGARHPPLMLRTARGLTLGTPSFVARVLYGRAFAVGPVVMGAGVPWTAKTRSGRLSGEMTIPAPHFHQIIHVIDAGTSIDSGCP
jgi:hypothetical protein